MSADGFLHKGRIVYSVEYELAGGNSIIGNGAVSEHALEQREE
jgi:hypothetical protein